MATVIAAVDIGSGTVKLSVFEIKEAGRIGQLELHEIDTQLRKGMGEELTLKDGPVADTLRAAAALKKRALKFEPASLVTYATSAVRRSKNPSILLDVLKEDLGLDCMVLSEADEGRLNLYGAQQWGSGGRWVGGFVAVDPGGDSTDAAWGADWQTADFVSLPFGSVALMEKHGRGNPADVIEEEVLTAARTAVYETLQACAPAAGLKGLHPLIRMNEAMRLCLARVCNLEPATGSFDADCAWKTALACGRADHQARREMLDGEPEGKLDRTPFGFASWAGLMDFMGAKNFGCDPWGIKLGAALAAYKKEGPWS